MAQLNLFCILFGFTIIGSIYHVFRGTEMKKSRKVPELVTQLKAVKIERGLSNQDIFDLLRAKKYGTSLSSVKRFFAEGSEDVAFSYEDTIKPLVEVLLVEVTPVPVEELDSLADAQQYIDQIEGLQATVLLKHTLIEELTNTNASLQSTVDTQAITIQQQAETIENLKKTKRNHRILIFFLVAAFVILALLAITYLIIHDIPNPHYGVFTTTVAGEISGFVDGAWIAENISEANI